jgi:hypothetical protein
MRIEFDPEADAYVIHDQELGDFYGVTPGQAQDYYIVALRIAADHARKNPEETR